jgi:hypothetical protein
MNEMRRKAERAITRLSSGLLCACLALLCGAAEARAQRGVRALDAAREGGFVQAERVALLVENEDGSRSVVARMVSTFFGKGVAPGDRLGNDVLINLRAFEGVKGEAVDVRISSIARPDSVLVLTDEFQIVEFKGVWGIGGTFYPTGIQTHGPFADVSACGRATALVETIRHFDDPLLGFDDPLLGYGTERGCVGFAHVRGIDPAA